MSKKTLRPKITKTEGFTESGLPTPDKVDESVHEVSAGYKRPNTPTVKPTLTPDDLRTPTEREPGLTSKGRARFTTMLRPDLRDKLETIAQNKGMSLADVLEIMITDYLDTLQK